MITSAIEKVELIRRFDLQPHPEGGFYRETLGSATETNAATNVGGGVKIGLSGPIRLRLDVRFIHLLGSPKYENVQRFYAGVNLKF